MDFATLQSRQIVALENVQELTARLARAQDFFGRITKRAQNDARVPRAAHTTRISR